jgi:hypothetical protein
MFSPKKISYSHEQKPWLTPGIRVSCADKRILYLVSTSSHDPNIKEYFKKYCKILTRVITAAKNLYYNTLIKKNLITIQKAHGIL